MAAATDHRSAGAAERRFAAQFSPIANSSAEPIGAGALHPLSGFRKARDGQFRRLSIV
jgi:hypothetical protein